MKLNSTRLTVACLAIAALAAPAGFAQQQQPTNSDPYQGVSQPPPDDLIVATPDTPAPQAQAVSCRSHAAAATARDV